MSRSATVAVVLVVTSAQFLVFLVNYSVSKLSVNFNSLVKFMHASEQNLN